MLPGVVVFLDVEDLTEGRGAESIDLSATVLVYCSEGYFASVNCMRELLRAVLLRKPIITLLEPEKRRGGLTLDEIKQQLLQADEPFVHEATSVSHANKYAFWRLDSEVAEWGFEMPSGQQLFDALCAKEPIEWNRIGAFQGAKPGCLPSASLLPPFCPCCDSCVASSAHSHPHHSPGGSAVAHWQM